MPQPPEWQRFKVGTPSTRPNWTNTDCQPLTTIEHVAHIPAAIRIVEDDTIRAGLISDKSRLNDKRIQVAWLSPNYWNNGFLYGNIWFSFDWRTLLSNKRAYWVESMTYGVEACRLLLTDQNRDGELDRYDPTTGDGPWWKAPDGNHYWNGNFCLEIMYEGNLPLQSAIDVGFVKHHSAYCNTDKKGCEFRTWMADKAGAIFLAGVVGRLNTCRVPGFVGKDGKPSHRLLVGFHTLVRMCDRLKTSGWGSIKADSPEAVPLARGFLGRVAADKAIGAAAVSLGALFKNSDELTTAVAEATAQTFGFADRNVLLEW